MRSPTCSSEWLITKAENLAIGTCTARLPVLIYSRPFVVPQICEMQGFEQYGLKRVFAAKGIVEKGL